MRQPYLSRLYSFFSFDISCRSSLVITYFRLICTDSNSDTSKCALDWSNSYFLQNCISKSRDKSNGSLKLTKWVMNWDRLLNTMFYASALEITAGFFTSSIFVAPPKNDPLILLKFRKPPMEVFSISFDFSKFLRASWNLKLMIFWTHIRHISGSRQSLCLSISLVKKHLRFPSK